MAIGFCLILHVLLNAPAPVKLSYGTKEWAGGIPRNRECAIWGPNHIPKTKAWSSIACNSVSKTNGLARVRKVHPQTTELSSRFSVVMPVSSEL